MLEFKLITSLLIPLAIGYAVILFISRNQIMPIFLRLALSYGMGMGILAFWMMLLGMFGQTFNLWTVGGPLLGIALILVLFLFISQKNEMKYDDDITYLNEISSSRNESLMSKGLKWLFLFVMIMYIFHNIFYVFWHAMNVPISTWDAIATVAFKAKIFYYEKSLPPLNFLPHKTYPLLVPLLQTWVTLNLEQWSDQLIKIIFPCAFLSYLCIQYYFLRFFTNKVWAILGCTILLSSNFFIYHATISYRDFFLMYYNCSTIMFLLLWSAHKEKSFYLLMASFFAGFASITKLEGTAFMMIYFFLFLLINFYFKGSYVKNRWINMIRFIVPVITIWIPFHIFKLVTGVVNSDKTQLEFSVEKILLIPQIILGFANNLFLSGNWNIVWWVMLISLIHWGRKRKNIEVKLISLSIILFFALYAAVALMTANYTWIAGENRITGLSRLILHFYPLSVLLIVLLNYPERPKSVD